MAYRPQLATRTTIGNAVHRTYKFDLRSRLGDGPILLYISEAEISGETVSRASLLTFCLDEDSENTYYGEIDPCQALDLAEALIAHSRHSEAEADIEEED